MQDETSKVRKAINDLPAKSMTPLQHLNAMPHGSDRARAIEAYLNREKKMADQRPSGGV